MKFKIKTHERSPKTQKRTISWLKTSISGLLAGIITLTGILIYSNFFYLPVFSEFIRSLQIRTKANTPIYKTIKIYISPDIGKLYLNLKPTLSKISYGQTKRFNFTNKQDADVILATTLTPTQESTVLSYIDLVPVAHLYSLKENFNLSSNSEIITTNLLCNLLQSNLKNKIKCLKNIEEVINALKKDTNKIAILLATDLNPQLKLLTINNNYYLDAPNKNPLRLRIILTSKNVDKYAIGITKSIINTRKLLPNLGLNSSQILKVNMTGVTAITRSLALKIEQTKDYKWPAKKLANFLKDADLTHTSNEVSFVPGCKPTSGMRFCSNPKYAATLEAIGLDIIELTGNHNNDYGVKWSTWSINNIYKPHNWDYFGGGLNSKDAAKILYKNLKGTKLAFIGYNYYDTMLHTHAIATNTHGGANSFSYTKLKNDISAAKKQGALTIVDFQYTECYAYPEKWGTLYPPCYRPIAGQTKLFRKAIDYGADVVIGTQAHQPQAFEIYKGKLIFYGLGNLFFDQWEWPGTSQGLILTHYFYNGKHLQTKITTIKYNRNLQPYITTGKERTTLLKYLLEARP